MSPDLPSETLMDEVEPATLPGSAEAFARGCCCSTMANAAYRAGVDESPLLEPACPLHPTWPDGARGG